MHFHLFLKVGLPSSNEPCDLVCPILAQSVGFPNVSECRLPGWSTGLGIPNLRAKMPVPLEAEHRKYGQGQFSSPQISAPLKIERCEQG